MQFLSAHSAMLYVKNRSHAYVKQSKSIVKLLIFRQE